eukprot:6198960-Pleurochrysis_carterae.AAC.1
MARRCRRAPGGPRRRVCKAHEGATAWESWLRCTPSTHRAYRTKAKRARPLSTWRVGAGARTPRAGAGGGKRLRREAT